MPRATKTFERLYRRRTTTERVVGRLKVFWGVDGGNVAGGASVLARVGLVMVVNAGLAMLLGRHRRGPMGQMRLSRIARALRENSS